MAGKIQKPYDQLQYKRGGRRRASVVLFPLQPPSPEAQARRDAALNAAIGGIERAFGRGPRAARASEAPEKPTRTYRPRGERAPNAAKAAAASARPRDAKGHFLPGKRRRPDPASSDLDAALAAAAPPDEETSGLARSFGRGRR